MERRYFDYAITGLAAGVTAYAKDTYFKGPNEVFISYGFSILLGFLAFILLNLARYLSERGLSLDARYRYLGTWIEDMQKAGQIHYSLFEIRHNIISNTFSVQGNTFDSLTHEPYADWSSTAVAFPEENRLYYLHKSEISGCPMVITGLTRLNFEGNYGGSGYIIDNVEPLERVNFTFERLDKSVIRQTIGKAKIRSKADRKAFFDHRYESFKRHEPKRSLG